MRNWLIAFSVLVLSACAANNYLPRNFERMAGTAVFLENVNVHGSGTIVAGNLVLTAAHVAEMGEMTLTLRDGSQRHASPLWKSETRDVAVMRFDGAPIKAVAVVDCKPIEWGEPVQWIGNPNILRWNFSRGYVSSPEPVMHPKTGESTGMVPLAAMLNPGDSGSGMLSEAGEVRGVGVASLLTRIGAGFGSSLSQSGNGLMVPASEFCADMVAGLK